MDMPQTPSLQFTTERIESPWLLLITLKGVPTLPDYQKFSDERLRYLETSRGHLYCICDWSTVEERLTPEIFGVMAKSAGHRHPNTGAIVSIGNQTLLKMVTTVIIPSFRNHSRNMAAKARQPASTLLVHGPKNSVEILAAVDPLKATGSALLVGP